MRKVMIMGAGAFGFALAKLVSENHKEKDVFLYDIQESYIAYIREKRQHPIFHDDALLGKNVVATHTLRDAVTDADVVVLALPMTAMREAITSLRGHISKPVTFINTAKGLEQHTWKRASEIIAEELKETTHECIVCALSGGMVAREVTMQNPLMADLGCPDKDVALDIAHLLTSDFFRIEITDDLLGVEFAGAFKNVVAVGAGIFDGLGYAESSKAAFVSAAAREMRTLAIKLGARAETFGPGSQAWFGNLMTACFGASRNREFGELLGKGFAVDDANELMRMKNRSFEGYNTASAVHELVVAHGIHAPILVALYEVMYKEHEAYLFVKKFIKGWA